MQGTPCPIGTYLRVTDTSKMTGTCEAKQPKADSKEIIIYVSNLAADIDRPQSEQTGDLSTPYVDLYKAIRYAERKGTM